MQQYKHSAPVGGRAATLSPKSRPKVHLPALRARARPDSHGDLRMKASGASGCTGLTGALRGVEQGTAIGFSMGATVYSHQLPSLRTHAPCQRSSLIFLGTVLSDTVYSRLRLTWTRQQAQLVGCTTIIYTYFVNGAVDCRPVFL